MAKLQRANGGIIEYRHDELFAKFAVEEGKGNRTSRRADFRL